LLRSAARPFRPIEAVEEAAADLVLFMHRRDRFFLIEGRPPSAAALRVGREGGLEFLRQTQVIHHESARFVLEDAVDPRDRLHQPVAAHRLIHIHRVKARRVEAGEPHVTHKHERP
jgi:hypothetical protein